MLNYHNHPAISASKLKKLACGTALDFWAEYEDPDRIPFLPSEQMRQGSVVDCKLTEPEKFNLRYVVAPKCDRRTTAGKAIWAEAQAEAAKKCAQVISEDWDFNANRIAEKLRSDPVASLYLRGQGQDPHFWYDTDHDIECRYLPDMEDPGKGLLLDLKKSRSANPRLFARQSYSLGYDIQGAHYAEGYRDRYGEYPRQIVLLAYEWEWPHNFSVNIISDALLEEGRRRREEAICVLKECRRSEEWPSWGVQVMDVPGWLRPEDPANDTDVSDLDLEGIE